MVIKNVMVPCLPAKSFGWPWWGQAGGQAPQAGPGYSSFLAPTGEYCPPLPGIKNIFYTHLCGTPMGLKEINDAEIRKYMKMHHFAYCLLLHFFFFSFNLSAFELGFIPLICCELCDHPPKYRCFFMNDFSDFLTYFLPRYEWDCSGRFLISIFVVRKNPWWKILWTCMTQALSIS